MTRLFPFLLLCSTVKAATIQRLWLSFQREKPTHITVNQEQLPLHRERHSALFDDMRIWQA